MQSIALQGEFVVGKTRTTAAEKLAYARANGFEECLRFFTEEHRTRFWKARPKKDEKAEYLWSLIEKLEPRRQVVDNEWRSLFTARLAADEKLKKAAKKAKKK